MGTKIQESANPLQSLMAGIADQSATVGVIGLGYVGVPLVRAFYRAGFACIGFDLDESKVESLTDGVNYIKHMDSTWLDPAINEGRFRPTPDFDLMDEADVLIICVPTPLSDARDPDLSYVEATARQIAKSLRPGQLVVLESTTYPGTTRDVIKPILDETGLECGKDYLLAYSPEREDPGNADFTADTIPKVVGGMDAPSLAAADELYKCAVVNTVPVNSCEVAEACKILENTYRCVNIALVNELKVLFQKMDIDVWEVIQAASTKPFGFQAFWPGPGLGGHCIPIDPFYLSWLARRQGLPSNFIELAGEVNRAMPNIVVQRIAEALNEAGKPIRGSRIGIMGVAYKRNVDDPRESPSFEIMELLNERGADLSYCDPHIPSLPKMRSFDVPALEGNECTDEYLGSLDCAVIVTDHSAFDFQQMADHAKCIVDTRNACVNVTGGRDHIWKA